MKDKLVALTEGKDFEKLKNYFINIIKKIAREKNLEDFLRHRVGDDFAEEVFNAFLLKLKIMENPLKNKEEINTLYVNKVIYSCIVEVLNSSRPEIEIPAGDIKREGEEGNVLDFEEVIPTIHEDYSIEAKDLFEIVMEIISEKDIEVLCYYLYKEFYSQEIQISGLSKSTLYKRWERLKKKLASELPYIPDEGEFREFAEKFLSEICNKRGLIPLKED